jgi:DNA-binding CsgD family transcriptional regulator
LTPTEALVATLLTDGETVAEIAHGLEVSVFTVRAHLRSIFVKTGVNRQAALIRLLLTDPGRASP